MLLYYREFLHPPKSFLETVKLFQVWIHVCYRNRKHVFLSSLHHKNWHTRLQCGSSRCNNKGELYWVPITISKPSRSWVRWLIQKPKTLWEHRERTHQFMQTHNPWRLKSKNINGYIKRKVTLKSSRAEMNIWISYILHNSSNNEQITLTPQNFLLGFLCNCLSCFTTAKITFNSIHHSQCICIIYIICTSSVLSPGFYLWGSQDPWCMRNRGPGDTLVGRTAFVKLLSTYFPTTLAWWSALAACLASVLVRNLNFPE